MGCTAEEREGGVVLVESGVVIIFNIVGIKIYEKCVLPGNLEQLLQMI